MVIGISEKQKFLKGERAPDPFFPGKWTGRMNFPD
jgi:hypothetical protein